MYERSCQDGAGGSFRVCAQPDTARQPNRIATAKAFRNWGRLRFIISKRHMSCRKSRQNRSISTGCPPRCATRTRAAAEKRVLEVMWLAFLLADERRVLTVTPR